MPQIKHPPDILDDGQPNDIMDSPPDILDDELSNESTIQPVNENEPDTWMKGFVNSITSGDALSAGLQGAKGFAKGAILDIPSSIAGMVKSGYNLATNPVETIKSIPSGISEAARNIWETTSHAGREPEKFGRMMGNITGQPAVTAGLVKASPSIIRGTGAVAEPTGRFIKNYKPFTSWMPRITEPRILTGAQRLGGAGMEYVGKKMKGFGKSEGGLTSPLEMPMTEGDTLAPKKYKVIRSETPSKVKPRVKPNGDGTFTNLDTGEILDSRMQPIIEMEGKPITKNPIDRNSNFFVKNQ